MTNKRKVSHPGVYVKDAIEELGMNQSEFALRTGLSIKNVSTLVSGDSNITFEVAVKLAAFFQNSVEAWLNLQTKYDLYQNEENQRIEYENDWKIIKLFDKKFVNDYLCISFEAKSKEDIVNTFRWKFNVGTLQALTRPDMYAFYKTSVTKDLNEKTTIMRNAWISIAEREAREISCSSFNKEKIISNTKYLRSLTLETPETFEPKLKEFLASCGVKLVILPYLANSNVSGVTKWIGNENCALVAINDCGKDADKIWFSLFHELGHVIKNHKRHLTISYDKNKILDEDEIEANAFAENSLIDKDAYEEFVNKQNFSLQSIDKFANKQGVADFVVIGRLQKDKLVSWDKFQNRKIKYETIF